MVSGLNVPRSIRIPMSLKIDNVEDPFYTDFVLPRQEDRSLSSLVVTLLQVYHTNPVVREEVDSYIERNSPYAKIREDIDRVALNHTKTLMATEALKDLIRTEQSKVNKAVVPKDDELNKAVDSIVIKKIEMEKKAIEQQELLTSPQDSGIADMDERLRALENILPAINTKLSTLLDALSHGVNSTVITETNKITSSSVGVPISNDSPLNNRIISQKDEIELEVVNTGYVSQQEYPSVEYISSVGYVENPSDIEEEKSGVTVQPSISNSSSVSETVENIEKPVSKVKPVAFGKMMKSLKK